MLIRGFKMAKKKMKWLWTTFGVLGIVGGLIHVLQGFLKYNLLTVFGQYSLWIQGIAGVATITYIVKKMM